MLTTAVFACELFVMVAIRFLPSLPPLLTAALDSALLVILLSPILYVLVFRRLILHIEQQERAEGALRTAATEWTRTFDAMAVAILVLDAGGRILRLNSAARRIADRDHAGCFGLQVGDLGEGEPWKTAAAMVGQADADRTPSPARVRDERTGTWWDVTVTPMLAGPECLSGLIITAREVSDVVALEESVRRSETMAAMGALVAGVAHEVRNPLFAISVNADALGAMFRDRAEIKEVLDALRKERDRLNELMANLLEYGRPQVTSLAEADLGEMVSEAVRSCAALAERYGVMIASGAPEERYRVRMDRSRLRKVFENLLENACQHSGSGDRVRLEAEGFSRAGEAWVRCVVSDSGPGFPPEALPRVFEPFFTRRRGGIGLGLAIAQRIVEEHGGRITARNGAVRGAEVTVELPCARG